MSRIAACRAACDAIDAAPSPRSAAVFLLTAALLSAALLLSKSKLCHKQHFEGSLNGNNTKEQWAVCVTRALLGRALLLSLVFLGLAGAVVIPPTRAAQRSQRRALAAA